ncbi:MAG TPA: hypothetical protein VHZ49_09365 [Methylomirabilota bacterium]|jgi:hypothetical protein|nr:hypothetical protein [Methylomirabilota bacterium]
MAPRLSGLKVFRPDVEAALKIGLAVMVLTAVLMPVVWAYRQHDEATVWHEVACTYRLKEALRDRLVTPADVTGRPCARLAELGLVLERPVLYPGARASVYDYAVWPSASVSE